MDLEYSEKEAVAIIEAEDGLRVYAFDDGNFTSNKLIPSISTFRNRFEMWGYHQHIPKEYALMIAIFSIPEYTHQNIEIVRGEEKAFTAEEGVIY